MLFVYTDRTKNSDRIFFVGKSAKPLMNGHIYDTMMTAERYSAFTARVREMTAF